MSELAFCATTIKYVSGLQVRAMAQDPQITMADRELVGWVVIAIDLSVFLAAIIATILLMRNLFIHASTADEEEDSLSLKVVPLTKDGAEEDLTGLRDWDVSDDDEEEDGKRQERWRVRRRRTRGRRTRTCLHFLLSRCAFKN